MLRKMILAALFCAIAALAVSAVCAAQREEISAQRVRSVVKEHVTGKMGRVMVYTVHDPVYRMDRRVQFLNFQNWVRKTGDRYYMRGLFQDLDNNEILDVDFYVGYDDKGKLAVVDESIHSVGGKTRYYYDAEGNKVPRGPGR
jgi:YD repeat-containing protein